MAVDRGHTVAGPWGRGSGKTLLDLVSGATIGLVSDTFSRAARWSVVAAAAVAAYQTIAALSTEGRNNSAF